MDMSSMFDSASSFNRDILHWETYSVTNMSSMFYGATSFNVDISQWDTSSVTSMSQMFYDATSFNTDMSQWDTSSVTSMSLMFYDARSFNGDISQWDTSSLRKMNNEEDCKDTFFDTKCVRNFCGLQECKQYTSSSHWVYMSDALLLSNDFESSVIQALAI